MMEIKTVSVTVLLACIYCSSLWAVGDEGQAGAFLRYGVGSRALGMGRAFVAVADDASSVYWNPAGMLGAKRSEMTSMYSNLYFDSRFSYIGAVFPRLVSNSKNKLSNLFFGSASAIGVGWIGLFTGEYEQRTCYKEKLGDFSISENAFFIAWARELVGWSGIFRCGLNLKFMNRNFSGLQPAYLEIGDINRDWTMGMDIGITVQPLNFLNLSPKIFLPFRLGFVVQNLIQPSWDNTGKHRDIFPRILRWGLSYRLIRGAYQIRAAYDMEHYRGTKIGNYFGVEGQMSAGDGFIFSCRTGFNNRTEGVSLGIGFAKSLSQFSFIKIDYAYGSHAFLSHDNRFSMTFHVGSDRGGGYFIRMSDRRDISRKEKMRYLLNVLGDYPNEHVYDAANTLADLDRNRKDFLMKFYGGKKKAEWLFEKTKTLLKQGDREDAQKKALEAVEEYAKEEAKLNDEEMVNYGEALIITGLPERASEILRKVQDENPTLRVLYLLGTAEKLSQNWDRAIDAFLQALKFTPEQVEKFKHEEDIAKIEFGDGPNQYPQREDKQSMVRLSLLGLGESFFGKNRYVNTLKAMNIFLNKEEFKEQLDSDRPPYPIFKDNYIVDDVFFLLGEAYLKLGLYKEALNAFAKVNRFYPTLDKALDGLVEEKIEKLIEKLIKK